MNRTPGQIKFWKERLQAIGSGFKMGMWRIQTDMGVLHQLFLDGKRMDYALSVLRREGKQILSTSFMF